MNTKLNILKRWIYVVSAFLVMASASFVTSGCAKKDNGPASKVATTPNDQLRGSCHGCPGKMTLLNSAVGTHFAMGGGVRLQLALRIFGESVGYAPVGPVAVDGYMFVGTDNGPYCRLPVGKYKVRTIQPGQTNGAQLYYGLQIEAAHIGSPTKVRLQLGDQTGVHTVNKVPAIPDVEGRPYNFALQKSVFVIGINDRPCDAYMGWFELQ